MSLLDNLRMISAAPPDNNPVVGEKQFTDCWQETRILDDDAYENLWDVTSDTLSIMTDENLPEDFSPEEILFLDTETTGLGGGAGTVAFLVGIGWLTEDGFTVQQFVMRDYPEEKFLLKRVSEAAENFPILCTFNGKTFDLPLLRTRFLMNRMKPDILDKPHLDLLHMSRSLWKMRLKKCNLVALEEKILGIPRENDLPGSEAPERYFSFLKTGDFSLLQEVIAHNRQDVASLSVLLAKMAGMYHSPEQISFGEDLLSMGKSLDNRRHRENAEECYKLALNASGGNVKDEVLWRLGENFRRQGRIDDAAALWENMVSQHRGGTAPMIALAKYYEHHLRNIPKALSATESAIALLSEPAIFSDNTQDIHRQMEELIHRHRRLIKKSTAG